jgi:hypothetical protein
VTQEDAVTELPDSIPVLDDVVEDDAGTAPVPHAAHRPLDELEALLTIAIHERADELVHNACREMEALLLEQVSDRLRAELPGLVARIVAEHFQGPERPH